ncbi:polysaccharide biosynthesis protein [Paenibacillus kyungheensis]|uniref:Polysaccharide biosynthesis protein n=1 Tax=Paenibacillus kyungheensis TaxID=1452732 RepID=A0AAX3M192_9BACL|nr:polysaccharide biosynthesis protein [Paenibacillus kyungheensis]WCT55997.1 polysaccharide biosynthesis protein [Paenibacillus kyungheensis]
MKESSPSSRMLKGAFILALAAVLSKLIGTIQKIPLQNIGGDGVFGIYNAVYPFYTLVLLVATAGFPAAVSKFVAERIAAGNEEGARRVLTISSVMLIVLGVVGGILMYIGAPLLADWIDNRHTEAAIRSSALALPLVPIMAGLRGYFQGMHNMIPTAVSQVAEQTIRVAAMVILLLMLDRNGAADDWIAAGATFGSAAGGAAGLLVMLIYWWIYRQKSAVRLSPSSIPNSVHEPVFPLLKALSLYALPICLGSLSAPLISLVDTFTVPRLLKGIGWSEAEAMVQFGIYNRGMPLVQLMSMLATSLSVLFIPALADARVRDRMDLVQSQSRQALSWFWLLGLAASAGVAVLAVPLDIMLYQDDAGSEAMRWLAFTGVGATVSIVTAALLQGMGSVKAPAVHLLLATVVKAVLNIVLVPYFGITGAAFAGIIGYAVAAVLNTWLLIRLTRLQVTWKQDLFKPLFLVMVMSCAVIAWMFGAEYVFDRWGLDGRIQASLITLGGVVIGAIVFAGGIFQLKIMTTAEIIALPKIGKKLAKLLQKFKLIS